MRYNETHFCDRWAPANTLRNVLSKEKVKLILNWQRNDQTFASKVVNQILPKHPVKNKGSRAAKENIEKFIQNIIRLGIPNVTKQSAKKLSEASAIFEKLKQDKKPFTEKQIDTIKTKIKPFIYGDQPLTKSLEKAKDIFSSSEYNECVKLLFVISDDNSTKDCSPAIKGLKKLMLKSLFGM